MTDVLANECRSNWRFCVRNIDVTDAYKQDHGERQDRALLCTSNPTKTKAVQNNLGLCAVAEHSHAGAHINCSRCEA